jgi:hypothetical protein
MDSAFARSPPAPGRTGELASRVELGYLAPSPNCQESPAAIFRHPTARVTSIAAALLALLSACGSSSPEPAPPACPTVLLLKGAERTAAYLPGPGTRPADLRYLAVLTDLVSVCRYEDDGVDVALRFNLIAEQGPAYTTGPLRLTYFVASLGPGQQVLSKPLFDVDIEFPEGQQRAGSSQEMTVQMPEVTPATGAQYSVFVGFQLDDEEMHRRLDPSEP